MPTQLDLQSRLQGERESDGNCIHAMQDKPEAAFIGVPPMYHGSIDDPKADIEVQLAKVGQEGFRHAHVQEIT